MTPAIDELDEPLLRRRIRRPEGDAFDDHIGGSFDGERHRKLRSEPRPIGHAPGAVGAVVPAVEAHSSTLNDHGLLVEAVATRRCPSPRLERQPGPPPRCRVGPLECPDRRRPHPAQRRLRVRGHPSTPSQLLSSNVVGFVRRRRHTGPLYNGASLRPRRPLRRPNPRHCRLIR